MKAILAYSDCQHVINDEEHVLIKYTNKYDFADTVYEVSPRPVFELRVHAMLFHEKFVESNESEELSDGSVVKISSSIKQQRTISVEPIPYYLALILKLALIHNWLEIDGVKYIKEENAEIRVINVRYPLCRLETDLTLEDGFVFNIFGKI